MASCPARALAALLTAAPILLPAFDVHAARSDLNVGSGGSGTNRTQLTADPFVLDMGGTIATVQFASTPLCVGLACAIDGPAVGAYLLAGNGSHQAESTARYTFSVIGGPDPVPILLSGLYDNQNPMELPDGLGGTVTSAGVNVLSSLFENLYAFQSICYNYTYFLNESSPPKNCGSGSFSGSFMAAAGSTLSVVITAFAGRVFTDAAPGAASAYVDPFFEIDPAWTALHPGYSLAFEAGVGNGAPGIVTSPVPEPETSALMVTGLAALLLRRKRRSGRKLS